MNVNPTDYFLDLVTPGTTLDQSDAFVAGFTSCQLPHVQESVERASRCQGQSVREMLESRDSERTTVGVHASPFSTQLGVLLHRKLLITLRNPMALGLPLFIPCVQGLVIGYMFKGIGEKT